MNARAKAILWFDCIPALLVGALFLALRGWLAQLLELPASLLLFMSIMNIVYACYSGSLAIRTAMGRTPSRVAIDVLIVANACWAGVCIGMLVATWRSASVLGSLHLALEGSFVAALSLAEYHRVRPFAR